MDYCVTKKCEGTCAGLVFLSKYVSQVKNGGQKFLESMDIKTERNYFGSQKDSFEVLIKTPCLKGKKPFRCLFIRAPVITAVDQDKVEALAELEKSGKSLIVAARQENKLVTAFHPELTDDPRWHQYFLDIVKSHKKSSKV